MRFLCVCLLLCFTVFCQVGCESPSDMTLYKRIRLGMDKGQVASILGGALRVDRFDGRDYWYYNLADDAGVPFQRMMVFSNSKLIYAGRVTEPAFVKDPSKQDAYHDRINEHVEEVNSLERIKGNTLPDPTFTEPLQPDPKVGQ